MKLSNIEYGCSLQNTARIILIFISLCSSKETNTALSFSCSEQQEKLPQIIKLKDLTLDPACIYTNAPISRDTSAKHVDSSSANFACQTCNTEECILITLGNNIYKLLISKNHDEAVKVFITYAKHLDQHEEMPPILLDDNLEICLSDFLEFINSVASDIEGHNVLRDMLLRHKDVLPFRLKDIVVMDSDLIPEIFREKGSEIESKRKLEDCSLRGLSVLFENYRTKYRKSIELKWQYKNALSHILFYSINPEKVVKSKNRLGLCLNILQKVPTLHILHFLPHLEKEIIPLVCLKSMEIAPYINDDALLGPFRRAVQELIDGNPNEYTIYVVLSWINVFSSHDAIMQKISEENYTIDFENFVKYINVAHKYKPYRRRLKELMAIYSYILPFKISNIMVSYYDLSSFLTSAMSKLSLITPVFSKKSFSRCTLQEIIMLSDKYSLKLTRRFIFPNTLFRNLVLSNMQLGNIPPESIDCALPDIFKDKVIYTLSDEQAIRLFENGFISFHDLLGSLSMDKENNVVLQILKKEIDNALAHGANFKTLPIFANYRWWQLKIRGANYYLSVSQLVKILEISFRQPEVLAFLKETLKESNYVLLFRLSNILVDGDGELRENERSLTDCNIQETVEIFHKYKSAGGEEVNKVFALILLYCVKIESSSEEDISSKVPPYFFDEIQGLTPSRFKDLVSTGIIPETYLSKVSAS